MFNVTPLRTLRVLGLHKTILEFIWENEHMKELSRKMKTKKCQGGGFPAGRSGRARPEEGLPGEQAHGVLGSGWGNDLSPCLREHKNNSG